MSGTLTDPGPRGDEPVSREQPKKSCPHGYAWAGACDTCTPAVRPPKSEGSS